MNDYSSSESNEGNSIKGPFCGKHQEYQAYVFYKETNSKSSTERLT